MFTERTMALLVFVSVKSVTHNGESGDSKSCTYLMGRTARLMATFVQMSVVVKPELVYVGYVVVGTKKDISC